MSVTKIALALVGIGCIFTVVGCGESNDFKVVDELSEGMTREQAGKTIESYGFRRELSLSRPAAGWPHTDESFDELPVRAKQVEEELSTTIEYAEYYPVHHGLLGFGQLFLFYDESGRLVKHYRRQIN